MRNRRKTSFGRTVFNHVKDFTNDLEAVLDCDEKLTIPPSSSEMTISAKHLYKSKPVQKSKSNLLASH